MDCCNGTACRYIVMVDGIGKVMCIDCLEDVEIFESIDGVKV